MAQVVFFIISLASLALIGADAQTTAFSAYKKNGFVKAVVGQPLVLPDLMISKGGGYDTSTGIFTVPHTGVYVLNLRVMVYGSNKLMGVDIVVGDKAVGSLSVYNFRQWDQNSITSIKYLRRGDKVSTRVNRLRPTNTKAVGRLSTVFSGYSIPGIEIA